MSTTTTPTPRLTREAIVEAADAIVREDGAGALSMRRLADELGVSTMAAYRHVKGKDHLVALVLDRALEAAVDLDDEDHRYDLSELVVRAGLALSTRPELAQHLTLHASVTQGDLLPALQRWLLEVSGQTRDSSATALALSLVWSIAADPGVRVHAGPVCALLGRQGVVAGSAA